MKRKRLLLSVGGALALGLLSAAAQAAPGQFSTIDESTQSGNLLTLVHGGRGGGGHGGGGHWGGGRRFAGGWGRGGRRFRGGFRGYGYGYGGYYGYDDGCWWRYGRWVCPGYGYPY